MEWPKKLIWQQKNHRWRRQNNGCRKPTRKQKNDHWLLRTNDHWWQQKNDWSIFCCRQRSFFCCQIGFVTNLSFVVADVHFFFGHPLSHKDFEFWLRKSTTIEKNRVFYSLDSQSRWSTLILITKNANPKPENRSSKVVREFCIYLVKTNFKNNRSVSKNGVLVECKNGT